MAARTPLLERKMSAQPGPPLLAVQSIAKRYGATVALGDASLRLYPGRVHALLGENGAGKSTLVKIIVGAVEADAGSIEIAGCDRRLRSVRDGIASGIVPIYQHLSLFPDLTVLENLSAFALAGSPGIRAHKAMMTRAEAARLLSAVGLAVDLDCCVSDLSIGERQLLEIARGLSQSCKVLVLDEPTAALTHEETDRLFGVIRRLCQAGAAVLFISHKLEEIEALADDVSVLRDGSTVIDCAPVAGISRSDLVRAMLGEEHHASRQDLPQPGPVLVRARGVRAAVSSRPFDVDIRAGEIVGIAGLVGSGALEIGAALAGARPGTSGTLAVGADMVPAGDRARAIAAGIGFVPSDRQSEALFPLLSAVKNVSASNLDRLTRAGFVQPRKEARSLMPWLSRMRLQPFVPHLSAGRFSGGNQQKLVVSRSLALEHLRFLVVLEPTRGVDIAARDIIHEAIVEAARRGAAVALASSDLDEILALSHRILVVRHGEIEQELGRRIDRKALTDCLAGRSPQ